MIDSGSIHGEQIQCDLCDFQAYPYDRVVKHQIQRHNICPDCGERFGNALLLKEHTDTFHRKKIPANTDIFVTKKGSTVVGIETPTVRFLGAKSSR